MYRLLIVGFCGIFTLTGCQLNQIVSSRTKPIRAADLAIKHIYRTPQKNRDLTALSRFHDPQLSRLIVIALQDAPDISAAKARLARARQSAKGAYSALWPSVDFDGSASREHFSFQGKIPTILDELLFTRLTTAGASIQAGYDVDLWGKNREGFASAVSQAFAARMDLAQARLTLSAAVASAYFQLQNNIIQLRLAKQNVALQQELQDITMDRAKQGIESDIPVKTAISDTQSARLSVENYKFAEMQSRHELAVLMGKNPFNTQIDPLPFRYNEQQLGLPEVIPANILACRPDINSARAQAEAAAHQIKVARTAFYPNINLKGLLTAQSFYFSHFFNLRFQMEGVQAAIDLPLFDAGERKANLGVRQAEFELAISQYNQTLLNALREVSDDLSNIQTLKQQVKDQAKALAITEGNYKLFSSRYQQGVIDYVQFIEIKQTIIQQKATLYDLEARHKRALVALLAALGGEVKNDKL